MCQGGIENVLFRDSGCHESCILSWELDACIMSSSEFRLTFETECCRSRIGAVITAVTPCSQKASELLETNSKSSSRKLWASHEEIEKSSQCCIICSGSKGIKWTVAVWAEVEPTFIGWDCITLWSLLPLLWEGILLGDANTRKGLYVSSNSFWETMVISRWLYCILYLRLSFFLSLVLW